jgi:hypothetical protein
MKLFKSACLFIFFAWSSVALADSSPYVLRYPALQGTRLPFISHQGVGPFDSALAMNTGYQPVLELRN